MARLKRNAHQDVPEKKKRSGHGPRKGSTYERKTCKFLSLWWTDQERNDIFWRTAGSGARATVRGKKGQTTANSAGDMGVLDPIGEPFLRFFMVEMKRGYPKAFDLLGILDRPKSYQTPKQKKDTFYGWWRKIKEDSIAENKRPLLIFQRDQSCSCVAIDAEDFDDFENTFGICQDKSRVYYSRWDYDIIFMTLDNFLSWINIDIIKGVTSDKN